jgi:hypothetical protein
VAIPWPVIPAPAPGTALGADLVHVTLALPTARDVWDKAKWDQDKWDSIDYSNFVDVSCDCSGVSVDRGRSGPLDHAAARAVLVPPRQPDGPLLAVEHDRRPRLGRAGPVLGPDVPVRVATASGPLFTGFVASVAESDDGGESTVTLAATDALSFLGDANGLEQASQGGGEMAGARLGRIMDQAAVPAIVDRALAAGVTALQATTLAKGALEEAWLTADSDGGVLWATPAGTVRYADPNVLQTTEFSEPVATFTDADNTATGTLCPISFTATSNRDHVKNVVSVARVGGTSQTVSDPVSVVAPRRPHHPAPTSSTPPTPGRPRSPSSCWPASRTPR